MAVIDPRKIGPVEQRLATETDPVKTQFNMHTHMKAEPASTSKDMSTVAEDARYHFFGSEDGEAFAGPKGKTNVEAFINRSHMDTTSNTTSIV